MKYVLTVLAFIALLSVARAGFNESTGVGNIWGNDYGPPADKDCPADPVDAPIRADERYPDTPEPAWGGGPLTFEYWGMTNMGVIPNPALCEWEVRRENLHLKMQRRCWPLFGGKPNVGPDEFSCSVGRKPNEIQ